MGLTRRTLLKSSLIAAAGCRTVRPTPADVAAHAMVGDVSADRAVVWTRAARPGRMIVEWSTRADFSDARRTEGGVASPATGLCAKARLEALPAGADLFYRTRVEDSPWVQGRLRTAPLDDRPVRFGFGGDTIGQGWGIERSLGLPVYRRMLDERFDFFVHSGDFVYADQPVASEVTLPDGTPWRNVVTEAKSKVAESLDEFRGQYLYNLLDDDYARFHREVPLIAQWDDHETKNNWYPGRRIEDERYRERSADVLAARARRAFVEHTPLAWMPDEDGRIYRRVPYGPHLEVFVLDARTYRGANTNNRRPTGEAFLGAAQADWLIEGLRSSKATWKIVASDMPLALVVTDGDDYEAVANGEAGPPLGREVEIARVLTSTKAVPNVVWITADVHFAAAHHFAPERAAKDVDFRPFWEIVAGPLHAGTFGPNALDPTFGPERVFQSTDASVVNAPPSAGLQFYGVGSVARDGALTLQLVNAAGEVVFERRLEHEAE